MEDVKQEMAGVYEKYRDKWIVTYSPLNKRLQKTGYIDSILEEFRNTLDKILQENINKLSNKEVDSVVEYANTLFENLSNISKK